MRSLLGRAARRLRAVAGAEPIVLMYHRVADAAVDPWAIAVSPARFEAQVEILRERRSIVPLDWLLAKVASGRTPRNAVAITFDDGYRDVLVAAKPVLMRHDAPATMFLATGLLGERGGMWWDRLADAILGAPPAAPGTPVEAEGLTFDAGADRQRSHLDVWNALKLLDPARRERALRAIEIAMGVSRASEPAAIMSREDVGTLVEGGWFSIGAHTVGHPSLPALRRTEKRREIAESRDAAEALSAGAGRRFAYPFGDRDAETVGLVRELGFACALGTKPGTVRRGGDVFDLPRYNVGNWTGERFAAELKWMR